MLDNEKCAIARRGKDNKIYCEKLGGDLCGHVYYCGMRGMWELSERARNCPAKEKEFKHGKQD